MVMEQQVERAMRTRPEDEVAKSLWRGRVSNAAEKAFRACDSAASEWAMSANEEIELYCVQEPAESFSKHK